MKKLKDQIKSLASNLNLASRISKAQTTNDRSVLLELATSDNVDVRMAVAANDNSDSRVLKALSRDMNVRVKINAAKNPNTPMDSLLDLATDDNKSVQAAVASNKSSYIDVTSVLLKTGDKHVLLALASNANTNTIALEQLASSLDEDICRAACRNLLSNHKYPSNEVMALSLSSKNTYERTNIAKTTDDPNILRILSKDANLGVKSAVANNKYTDDETIYEMANIEKTSGF